MSRKPATDKGARETSREDRLKAALKANLQKRKAQASARSGTEKTDKTGEAG